MTTLLQWADRDRACVVFVANGAVEARIDDAEARSHDDWQRLIRARLTGLIWLAMPGHEGPRKAMHDLEPGHWL